jgi:hypothetical protein
MNLTIASTSAGVQSRSLPFPSPSTVPGGILPAWIQCLSVSRVKDNLRASWLMLILFASVTIVLRPRVCFYSRDPVRDGLRGSPEGR